MPLCLWTWKHGLNTNVVFVKGASISVDEPPIMISTDEEQDTIVVVPQRSSESTRSVPELEIHSRMRTDTHPLGHPSQGPSSVPSGHEGFCSSCRRHRYLVPTTHRRHHPHCSRCESVTHYSGDSLTRHASKDSIRSVHLTESYPNTSGPNVTNRDVLIRRQHSQPEATCLYCQTHR